MWSDMLNGMLALAAILVPLILVGLILKRGERRRGPRASVRSEPAHRESPDSTHGA